jgi:hypothetical protein
VHATPNLNKLTQTHDARTICRPCRRPLMEYFLIGRKMRDDVKNPPGAGQSAHG